MEGVVGDKSGKRAVPNLELAQWRFALAANADDICPDRAHVQTMLRAEIIRNSTRRLAAAAPPPLACRA